MTYEPPAGILVGPDAVEGTNEGDAVEEFLPESLADIEEMGRGRSRPGLVPVGIARTADPDNHTTFKQIFNVWIRPEIERRVRAGTSTDSLTPVRQALIVFPPRSAPERYRVLLNGEVGVRAAVRPSYPGSFSAANVGQEMQLRLRDMFDLRGFALEGVNMETEGFVWIRPEAGRLGIVRQ